MSGFTNLDAARLRELEGLQDDLGGLSPELAAELSELMNREDAAFCAEHAEPQS